MKVREFVEKIESGDAQVLTLENAKNLIGKEIYWVYFGCDQNEAGVFRTKIGSIVTEKEYYTKIDNSPVQGFANRYEYWCNKCKKAAVESEDKLLILDAKNISTYIYCHKNNPYYKEPTFTCSDMDREVYYLEVE